MPALAFPYPVALTNKSWQKNKGLFAKAKPTGIGETLIALEKDFAASPFGKLDPAEMGKETADPMRYKKKRDNLSKALTSQGGKLHQRCATTEKTIRAAKPMFANDKAVTKVLDDLLVELAKFGTAISTGYPHALLTATDKAYKEHLQSTWGYKAFSDAVRAHDKKCADTLQMIKKLEAAKTIATVYKLFGSDGPHRSLTTNCKLWDQYAERDFPELARSIYAGKAMVDYAAQPWMMEVANETRGDATSRLEDMVKHGMSEERAVTKMALEYSRSVLKVREMSKNFASVWNVISKV